MTTVCRTEKRSAIAGFAALLHLDGGIVATTLEILVGVGSKAVAFWWTVV
jgi:hypothetical protein